MNKLLEKGIIKTNPKKWSLQEEQLILELKSSGKTIAEIAETTSRSEISISIKMKRLTKTGDTYNKKHRDDKYKHNQLFIEMIKPKSILDLYAGNSFYKENVTTNDKDSRFGCEYNMEALDLLCVMHLDRRKFDIVDLDPYGSAVAEFPLALRLAKKGIVITLGELGHKRWKRLDFVSKWHNIQSMEDFTTERIIDHLVRIGLQHKKKLTPVFIREYNRISRVWFQIEDYKEVSQWL